MERICIYLDLEPWLAQWYIDDAGGNIPISLPRLSVEHKIFEVFLVPTPPNVVPDLASEGSVAIQIPSLRYKPATQYNYLPKCAKSELRKCIRNRFVIQLWNDLHNFGYIGKRRDQLIYSWMENHGIECTDRNWNAIAKIYQRQYYNYYYRKKYRESKSK